MAKRGRPAFKPKAADRKKARKMAEAGHTEAEIADELRLSIPTLKKHFSSELVSRKKTGALPFKATAATRNRVQRRAGWGWSAAEIADLLGCTEGQINEHFADELRRGKLFLKERAEDDLEEQSAAGKTSASAAMKAAAAGQEAAAGAVAPSGKKVAAQAAAAAAVAAGGKFTPMLPPKLIVDNT